MKIARGETIALEKTKQKAVTKKTKQLKKKLESGKITIKEDRKERRINLDKSRGLIYIGHLPHGFYEDEMKQYFKQFGAVTNVKVCRSNKTGNSKGYGYVEFLHPEVAKVAAETMNNYIMFKKRLTAEFVPNERRPKSLFHGKQSMPENYSKLRKRIRNNSSRNEDIDEETHVKQSRMMLRSLEKRLQKIKDLGIDYELKPVDIPEQLSKS